MTLTYSQQVDWYTVHEYVAPILNNVGAWPMAGSIEWQNLPDGDARKVAAVLDAARHHILRVEIAQEAMSDASQAISAGTDWSAVAQNVRNRTEFHSAHPWAKRVAA